MRGNSYETGNRPSRGRHGGDTGHVGTVSPSGSTETAKSFGTNARHARKLPRDWPYRRRAALERDEYACVQCHKRGRLEVDHIVPRWKGGGDELENLQCLCRDCHIVKTLEENGSCRGAGDWMRFAMKKGAPRRARGDLFDAGS